MWGWFMRGEIRLTLLTLLREWGRERVRYRFPPLPPHTHGLKHPARNVRTYPNG